MKTKLILTAVLSAGLLMGCASFHDKEGRIHLITEEEAQAAQCEHLNYAGSASGILINGKKRNTQVIVRKALTIPGATHISYTKGEAGWAFTRANIWRCPNPDMKSTDPETLALARKYVGHE